MSVARHVPGGVNEIVVHTVHNTLRIESIEAMGNSITMYKNQAFATAQNSWAMFSDIQALDPLKM